MCRPKSSSWLSSTQVDPEYIPSDYGFQRYFTRAQTRLYVNDIFIDEFHHIMWELQANLIPKFGYCSFKFDDVAQGKSLVQGQLAINFVSPGYLIGKTAGAQVHHKFLGKSPTTRAFSLRAPLPPSRSVAT